MGKGKKLIILLVVVALLVGGYFAAKHFLSDSEAADETDAETVPVKAMQTDDVAGVLYVCGSETIELEKDGDTWYLKSDRSFPVKQAYADTMAADAANLEAVRLVSEDAAKLAEYGLKEPDTAYVFTLADGTQVTYYIGNYNSFGGTYYMNVAGTPQIYLISGDFLDDFGHSLQELADVGEMQTVSTESVRNMTLTLDSETTRVFYAPDGLKTVYSDMFTWFTDEQTPADPSAAQDLVGKAASFASHGCADYKAQADELAAYGLDTPALTVRFDYTVTEKEDTGKLDPDGKPITETVEREKTMTLLVGGASDNGSLYAKTDTSDVVYLIDAEYLQTLRDFDMQTLRTKRVCAVQLSDLASMDVTIDGKTSTVTVEHAKDDEEESVYKLDGKQISAEKFNAFYSAVQSLSAEAFAQEAVAADDATIAITFHTDRKGFETFEVRLKPYDNNFYTDANGALINKRDAESIIKTFESIGE